MYCSKAVCFVVVLPPERTGSNAHRTGAQLGPFLTWAPSFTMRGVKERKKFSDLFFGGWGEIVRVPIRLLTPPPSDYATDNITLRVCNLCSSSLSYTLSYSST